MKNFTKNVVVITGAGSGIGRELAYQFAAKGAILALNDWDETSLEETWAALPAASQGVKATYDVGDQQCTEDFAARVNKALGGVDVVINNAGMSVRQQSSEQSTAEDYEKVLRVNLYGVIHGSLVFLPHLRQRPNSVLVNISSVFGLMGYPRSAPYNVSKFAVRGFTETLRVELRKEPIQIVCVHPGGIQTNIARNVEIENPEERERFIRGFERSAPTTAVDAAKTIIRGIERGKQRILIGSDAKMIDWATRLFPATYERVLKKFLR
ncbi:SDR family NAD(P)-dependent oxidoreductase [Neolewinella antarctica]|uniref:Butyryl-CoA dehydrogenase n=1 Tax=Neolewinella antarctica TaxID=442734 RepID=A0ABX0XG66_9BACT|nr:SDR family oxidoreductase [Neolewinella antarctica]NJC28207.1 butyryl-CoA dehydrogenase [Neolewinella antarctica]